MQTITWSADLHSEVKKIKALINNKKDSLTTNSELVSTFSITLSEEKSIKESFKNVNKADTNGIWV
jgi:hypothetical protein